MAAINTSQGGSGGTEFHVGRRRSIITATGTDVLKTRGGKVASMMVPNVGTTWVIDIYDDPATSNNRIFGWVSADGKGPFAIQCPCPSGITVINSGGAAGSATIVWS